MSPFELAGDPLKIVATAVTPVVMVSASAILVSGVNSRYIAIADRMRNLAHEYRTEHPTEARQLNIREQMLVFHRRVHLVSWATRCLYASVGCFVAAALLISISLWQKMIEMLVLPLFLVGLVQVVMAIALQLVELQEANITIHLEAADLLEIPTSAGSHTTRGTNR